MPEAFWLAAALALDAIGLAWLAVGIESHWHQVRGRAAPTLAAVRRLRVAGGVALAASFGACLAADHASMAVLVWVMAQAAGATVVALVLAWRPHWLRPLAAWA